MTLSSRARELQTKPSAIMLGHELCSNNPYSLANPKGFLNFGTAQNHLLNEILLPKMSKAPTMDVQHIQYNCLFGMEDVRKSVTYFLENHLNTGQLNFDNLIIQTGVSSICESLSFALFDENDVIMIAAPFYSGFKHDFTKRFKCKFLKVELDPNQEFEHNIEFFKKAYDDYENPDQIKAVLLTHPNNPTGEVLTANFMEDISNFCLNQDLELISDEIYGLSYHYNTKHQSLYKYATEKGCKTHLLYGMAKDFALAGLKVGFFYSNDEELLGSMKNLSYFHPVSTQTQLLVKNLLDDEEFIGKVITTNSIKLNEISILLMNQLPMYRFIQPHAGLFTLIDLSSYVQNFEEEETLFNSFINFVKINMTPGKELGLLNPGYFRVCFARPKEDILEFIVRMKLFYENELRR